MMRKVKKYVQAFSYVCAFILTGIAAYSQSVPNQFVGTTGNFFKDATSSYSYSVGELAVTAISSDSMGITQGFLQPAKSILTSYESFEDQLKSNLHLFPNPGNSLLYVEFITPMNKNYQLEIYSLLGQRILHQKMNKNVININVSSLSSGNYWIVLKSVTNEVVAKAPYKIL